MARLTDQDQNPNDDAVVQGLSGYSMVGLGVMATLNQNALDSVSTTDSDVLIKLKKIART